MLFTVLAFGTVQDRRHSAPIPKKTAKETSSDVGLTSDHAPRVEHVGNSTAGTGEGAKRRQGTLDSETQANTPANSTIQNADLIAVLISGQRARFLFQDSNFVLGPLSHIFIRLQDWDFTPPRHWTGPAPIRPPYAVEPDMIKDYYLQRGTAFVQLKMVGHLELKEWRQLLDTNVQLPSDRSKTQYTANANMLLLRHLVFQDMLRSETERGVRYGQIIFMREDTVFFPFGESIAPHFLPQNVATKCPISLAASPCVVGRSGTNSQKSAHS